MKQLDLTGQKFGRLTCLNKSGSMTSNRLVVWVCLCDCGKTALVPSNSLRTGNTKSCGCLNLELVKSRFIKHGQCKTKEYLTWTRMIDRCSNSGTIGWKNYGGRGVKVCDAWRRSFIRFLKDIGPAPSTKHSIDRIDNDKGYQPGNVRWATFAEQCTNKRSNINLTINGETKCLQEWCDKYKINRVTVRGRMKNNWPLELLFTKPKKMFQV